MCWRSPSHGVQIPPLAHHRKAAESQTAAARRFISIFVPEGMETCHCLRDGLQGCRPQLPAGRELPPSTIQLPASLLLPATVCRQRRHSQKKEEGENCLKRQKHLPRLPAAWHAALPPTEPGTDPQPRPNQLIRCPSCSNTARRGAPLQPKAAVFFAGKCFRAGFAPAGADPANAPADGKGKDMAREQGHQKRLLQLLSDWLKSSHPLPLSAEEPCAGRGMLRCRGRDVFVTRQE